MKDIRDFTLDELKREIKNMNEPEHRARQIFLWLNKKNADSFESMTDIPKTLAARLSGVFIIGKLKLARHLTSKDGTEKFLWDLGKGEYIETVLIREQDRRTLCLSTQLGCKFKCPFCASGLKKFIRNLHVSEIVNQVLIVQKTSAERATNIVFMGMGEPLDNYDNLEKSIRIINHADGIGLGARKITVSTCGFVPGMKKLKDIGLQVELAVSLHAGYDKLRDELVPVNRRYPLSELLSACEEYYERTRRIITFEYTLIKGKNDSLKDADRLVKIAKRINAKVNLVAVNPFPKLDCPEVTKGEMAQFARYLQRNGLPATIRKSKGQDILAACGQLAARDMV
ncbi:MAG: 23S rRNA (adenine(2503)-C(2))-methyltransferase RlmN [Candidatus Omnitrophota bacterium]